MRTEAYVLIRERDLTERQFAHLLARAAPEKRERIRRFHHYDDAQRSLLGDALVRRLACDKLGLQSHELFFVTNDHGKPFLEGCPEFCFNVSHSGRYVACVLDSRPAGVDAEEMKPVDLKLARRFFTPDELAMVLAQAPGRQTEAFFDIWTKKESFVKREGGGLSIPSRSFSVCAQRDGGPYFHRLYTGADVIVSACTGRSEPPSLTLLGVEYVIV